MMSKRTFLIAAVAVALCQSLVIFGMLAVYHSRLNSGREVVIRSAFVDPRSLFRGHYVIINLQLGDLAKSRTETDGAFKFRDTVYVELVKTDTVYWEAKRLWHKVPEASPNPIIKGVMMSTSRDSERSYRIVFPFNRYFAARNRAKALERIQADQELGVVISLSEDGSGVIKGLMVDGQLVYDERVF